MEMSKNQTDQKLPEYLSIYFWDVDFQTLSKDYSYFIINRLLERGDEIGIRYMLKNFSRREIIEVLKSSRNLSYRSRNFWKLFFKIDEELCIPKQYPTPYGNYFQD